MAFAITNSAEIYFSKVTNGKNRTMCEICSKSRLNTIARRQLRRSDAFTFNFKQISHIFLVFNYWLWTSKCWLRTNFTFPQMHNFIPMHKKRKFSIENFYSNWYQILNLIRIWLHLLKKYLLDHSIFWAMLEIFYIQTTNPK